MRLALAILRQAVERLRQAFQREGIDSLGALGHVLRNGGDVLGRQGGKPRHLAPAAEDHRAHRGFLHPIADAAQALGARREEARLLMADIFAHAAGLLLLAHTGRIRMFGASAPHLMERFVDSATLALTEKKKR